jgi:hypothetical protein
MDDTAWAELEIARTDDQAAIRRAYAARLKAIGADRDSAAFMRLRRAYEEALAGASVSAADEDEEDDGGASPAIDDELTLAVPAGRASAAQQMAGWPEPSIERAAGSEIVLPYGAFDRFRQVFEERIAASDTLGAAGSLKTALAEGIVTIGGERELVRALAICGLADTALTLDEIEEIGRTFQAQMAGRGDSILEPLRCLLARAEALRWQARILRDARLGDSWVIGRAPSVFIKRVRIARAIRDRANENLITRDLPAFRAEVDKAIRYARWLDGEIKPALVQEKLQRLERTLKGQEFLAIAAGTIFILLLALYNGWMALALGTATAVSLIWVCFFS